MYKKTIDDNIVETRKEKQKRAFKKWAQNNVRNITFSINFTKDPELYDAIFVQHGSNKAEFIRTCILEHLNKNK